MVRGLIVPVKPDGTAFASSSSSGAGDIGTLWKSSNAKPRPGETRIFYGQGQDKETVLALVGVGKTDKLSENECVKTAAAAAEMLKLMLVCCRDFPG